jgi:outer membrane murein-binding lipoprotein Lpp
VSAIEALRAALASGPTRTPWDHRGRLTASENHGGYSIISPGGWCLAIVQPIDTDGLTGGLNAAYIAAACNAAPELLAEVDRLTAERDALRDWREIAEHASREAAALRQNARRYEWLRDRMLAADFDYEGSQVLVFEMPDGFEASADCDDTIDAAMKERT